jgi:Tol biopolymer transport system component
VPNNDPRRMRPVTTGTGRADTPTAWTPDGRIVYHSNVGGEYDIWITAAGGGSPQQLTRNARINQGPAVSPDGRSIVFLSDRTGTPHLWRMNLDGSGPRQLTDGPRGEQNPRFSPDGRWIVYRTSSGRPTTWKVPADGGEPVPITDKMSFSPTVSPDGRWIAYLYQDDNAPLRIAVAPFEGGLPVRTFPFTSNPGGLRFIRWTRDGGALAYIETVNDISNIVAQPLDGGQPVRLTNFTDGRLFDSPGLPTARNWRFRAAPLPATWC